MRCLLGRGRCTPCRLREAGDEKQSAKPSPRRNLTRDWAGTSRVRAGNRGHGPSDATERGQWQAWSCSCHFVWIGGSPTTTSRHAMGEAAGSAEAQPVQGLPVSWASWGRGLLGEEREDEQFGGSFARITSNRQAETTGRSVRSEGRDSAAQGMVRGGGFR